MSDVWHSWKCGRVVSGHIRIVSDGPPTYTQTEVEKREECISQKVISVCGHYTFTSCSTLTARSCPQTRVKHVYKLDSCSVIHRQPPTPVNALPEWSPLHVVVVIHWVYRQVSSCACAAADHRRPSTIRVGLGLLFQFKGVCVCRWGD